jgi:hypothetical protein
MFGFWNPTGLYMEASFAPFRHFHRDIEGYACSHTSCWSQLHEAGQV